jgi:YtxH-like protein
MRLRDVSNQMPSAEDFLSALGLEMRRSNSESMLSSLAIFAAGVTVGVAAALLFAPQSGSETRADIGNRVNRLRDEYGSQSDSSVTHS